MSSVLETIIADIKTKGWSFCSHIVDQKTLEQIQQLFENDFDNYTFIVTNNLIIEKARLLLSKYGLQGLRTLDSIQLSTAVSLTSKADTFITSDALLNTFFEKENLNTKIDIR